MALIRWFNQVVRSERFIYRWHRWVGGFALAGSLYVLWFVAVVDPRDATLAAVNLHQQRFLPVTQWMLDAYVVVLSVAALCVAVISLILIFRPSALRSVEDRLNQWYSARALLPADKLRRYPAGRFVLRHRIVIGVMIVLVLFFLLR